MNPENQLTADRDAGSVTLRDSGRVMAAPAEFFSMFSYAVASFGGEVPVVLREMGETWGHADAERFECECADPGDLPVVHFSSMCADRLAGLGFGRAVIEEYRDAAVVELPAPPPHAMDLLAGWFSSVLTRCADFPLSCRSGEIGNEPRTRLEVVAAEQGENAEDRRSNTE